MITAAAQAGIVSRRRSLRVGLALVGVLAAAVILYLRAQDDLCAHTGKTGIPQAECAALVALYQATDGANWFNHFVPNNQSNTWLEWFAGRFSHSEDRSAWLSGDTPCDWYGVTCAGGHISALDLPGNWLKGELPPEIGNLTHLELLSLGNNTQLQGTLPLELGRLTLLRTLILENDRFSGSLLPEIGNLANLEILILNNNQLSGAIPPELGNLAGLRVLDLSINRLTGEIPPELGALHNLIMLKLHDNQLQGEIPATITRLTRLRILAICRGNELVVADPVVARFMTMTAHDPGWETDCVDGTMIEEH